MYLSLLIICACLLIPEVGASAVTEACASEIDNWMRVNKLKLDTDKPELLIISSKYRPRPLLDSISINDNVAQPSTSARNLGFVMDNSLTLEKHVNSLTKSAFFHL